MLEPISLLKYNLFMLLANIVIRSTTILLLLLRELYWRVSGKRADREKPKTPVKSLDAFITYYYHWIVHIIAYLQLLGLPLLQMPYHLWVQIVGFLLVVIGVSVSTLGRKDVGVNWTEASEYQVKKNHKLVTTGIYRFIRHPIYSGSLLSLLGTELVVTSYFFIYVLVIHLIGAIRQARREEKILLKQFGQNYIQYRKRTKMFIPYIV